MKKVYHIALSNPIFPNGGWQKAFEENGYDYVSINWQHIKRLHGKDLMWDLIYEDCERIKPDLIFSQIQTPNILGKYEAEKLSQLGFTVNYTMDVREDLSWYEDIAEHMGLLLFCDYESVERMKARRINNVDYLQQSCDTDFYKPIETDKNYGEIVFIGNNFQNTNLNFPLAEQRVEMVKFMMNTFGDRFRAYGRGFPNQMLNPEQEIEAYSSCKVAITHNHFKRVGYFSDRGMRAMGCGAFTIHQYYEGIENDTLFSTSWKSLSQLKQTCVSALLNDTLRRKIAHQEYMNCLSHNSWLARIHKLKALVNEQCARVK